MITTDVAEAAARLRAGGLVAMPTETVYGLAADATDRAAIARIYAVKGRPADHPLIVHVADPDDVATLIPDLPDTARRLGAAAWPGPLTVIVRRPPGLPPEVAGGRDTVGIRVPAHPTARELIRCAGVPVAAPSANRFGSVSPTSAAHVERDLGDRLDRGRDAILDGGSSEVGVESTIVDCVSDPVQILRAGAITRDHVHELLGAVADASGPARASGMLASHYAPACQVRLVDSADDAIALRAGTPGSRVLDLTDDPVRYARDLYAELRRADDDGVSTLVAVLPEPAGLGHAIRDRLTKAAAPR
ncbi:MAG: L-threonylcarbamoyladenylate synthase [Actinomycetota bacterium]